MLGETPSAGLHPTKSIAGLAAGLPHFAKGHMRCWGRDLFISLRGLLLVTGRFAEAREHLLALASVVRHGLIPNLLDSGRFPRYNARDATWFFLQALQDYCTMTEHASKEGHGVAILDVQIARRFPSDEFIVHDDPAAFSRTSTLRGIVHEIMERHAQGIHFREYNAGPALDHAMRSEGFQIDIEMDRSTGFVHGGNRWNCGTWMDKMGDSDKAGTKGMPATPRDGAAVEIVGLCKSTVRWLAKLADDGKFPRDVKLTASGSSSMSYCSWNDLIQTNFERCFYVPMEEEDDGTFDFVQKSVHRRGIYKDTYRSTLDFTDYQLRPNFPIAMVVAPEVEGGRSDPVSP